MTETSSKRRRLMALLSKAGIDDDTRHNLVYAWTNGRTNSSRELTGSEVDDLVWKFENDFLFRANPRQAASALMELAIKQKRSAVLAIAQRTGIHEGASFSRFNQWMKNRSVLKKRLNDYTFDELDQLIQQMHALEANFKRSAEKAFSKAWHQHYNIPEVESN